MQSNDWIELAFKLGVFIVVFLFYNVLSPALKAWVSKSVSEQTATVVSDAVKAAQQTISENKEKKLWVMSVATEKLNELGINISAEELDKLIEATVFTVKNTEV